jgi:hypothetical protein
MGTSCINTFYSDTQLCDTGRLYLGSRAYQGLSVGEGSTDSQAFEASLVEERVGAGWSCPVDGRACVGC